MTGLIKTRIPHKKIMILLVITCLCLIQCESIESKQDPNANFERGVPVSVGPDGYNSAFSYYNTSPESPGGSLISYVKIISAQPDRYTHLTGELWVCNADLSNHKMIVELKNFQVHNGVNAQWID